MERPGSTSAVFRLPTYGTVANGTHWVAPKKEPESPPPSRIGDINFGPSPRSLSSEMLGVHADEPVPAGMRTPVNSLAEVDGFGMGSPSGGSIGASDMVPTNIQTAAASFPALLNIWARFATAKPVASPINGMQSLMESVQASSTVQASDILFAPVDNGRVSLRNNQEPVTGRPGGLHGPTVAAIHNANDEMKQRELYQLQLEILEHSEKVDLVENQFIEDMNASYQHQAEIARLANECDSLRARIVNLQKELAEKEAQRQRVDGARNQLHLKLAMSKQQLGEMKAEAATKRADLLARLKYVQIGQNAGLQPLGISTLEKHTSSPNQLISTLNSNVLDTSKPPPLSSNEIAMQTEEGSSNRAMLPTLKNKGAAVESRWSPISEIETAPEAPLEDAVQKLFESISQTPRRLGSEPQRESRTDERPVVISIIERDTDPSKQALSESRDVTPSRGNDNRRTEKSCSPERTSMNPYFIASGKRQRVAVQDLSPCLKVQDLADHLRGHIAETPLPPVRSRDGVFDLPSVIAGRFNPQSSGSQASGSQRPHFQPSNNQVIFSDGHRLGIFELSSRDGDHDTGVSTSGQGHYTNPTSGATDNTPSSQTGRPIARPRGRFAPNEPAVAPPREPAATFAFGSGLSTGFSFAAPGATQANARSGNNRGRLTDGPSRFNQTVGLFGSARTTASGSSTSRSGRSSCGQSSRPTPRSGTYTRANGDDIHEKYKRFCERRQRNKEWMTNDEEAVALARDLKLCLDVR
ncbi:hypothetical protein SpCBS45565_g01983 [Spizellomyces sp. 'palustris']|nr:hypothetical protein SpCBS45565_g01983 [Spizellomyces sp. 'palustris']